MNRQMETLQELREEEKDEALEAHAEAVARAEELEEEVERIRARLSGVRRDARRARDRMAGVDDSVGASDLRRFGMFVDACGVDEVRLKSELEIAEKKCRDQRAVVSEREEELREANKRLEAVERHIETQRSLERERQQRRRERRRDETAGRVWRENTDE